MTLDAHGRAMRDLCGKVALVTGSSTGIGAAAASGLAQQGCRVAVHHASQKRATADVVAHITAASGEAAPFWADVAAPQVASLVEGALAHSRQIDILVNKAGSIVQRILLAEADDMLIDRVCHLDAWSMLAMCRAALPG